ncbi:MAG: M48 family metallopeptidase, partial [Lentisphaerota bacterium]
MWDLIHSNRRKSLIMVTLLAAVLMLMGYAIGGSLDPKAGGVFGVLVALAVWFIMMAVSLAGGEKILLASAGAREVQHDDAPQLYNIVEEMKIASGLPAMPRVYIIDSEVPNAFAVGLKPERAAVAVTTGLLARLNRDELQGVVAHELGHISNRDTLFMTLGGVTVGAVIILADIYLRGIIYGGGRGRRSSSKGEGQAAAIMAILALVAAVLAPLLAQLLYFACSRRREYLADASAAQFTRFPDGLASALEKISGSQGQALKVNRAVAPMFIVNPLAAAGSASSWFSTHPSTPDRIKVLRGMAKDSSLTAYEESYRALHQQGVVGARTLKTLSAAAT